MQPERKLVQKIQRYLEAQGARSFKIHGDDSYQEAGIPDLLVCYRGRFIGLEVKLPGGKPSLIQEVVLSDIKRSGGIAAVVESVDQVRQLLAKLERKR